MKKYLVIQSRQMLAVDTLNDAIEKDTLSVRCLVGNLLGANVFQKHEATYAKEIVDSFERHETRIMEIFDAVRGNARKASLLINPNDLLSEVSALRECAFWLLDATGQRAVENEVRNLIGIYERVRRLVRVIVAKAEISMPEDPAQAPDIPSNPYAVHRRRLD